MAPPDIRHAVHELAGLSGRPAGISFSHVASALLYCEELVSMLDPGALNVTLLLRNVGSGKSGTPCERIQAAALR
jgi:hypothetical protein